MVAADARIVRCQMNETIHSGVLHFRMTPHIHILIVLACSQIAPNKFAHLGLP
jgi:hypothetical protein